MTARVEPYQRTYPSRPVGEAHAPIWCKNKIASFVRDNTVHIDPDFSIRPDDIRVEPSLYFSMMSKQTVQMQYMVVEQSSGSVIRANQENLFYFNDLPILVNVNMTWGQFAYENLTRHNNIFDHVWLINRKVWDGLEQPLADVAYIGYDPCVTDLERFSASNFIVNVILVARPIPLVEFLQETLWGPGYHSWNNAEYCYKEALKFLQTHQNTTILERWWLQYDLWGQLEQFCNSPYWELPFLVEFEWLSRYAKTFTRAYLLLQQQAAEYPKRLVMDLMLRYGVHTLTEMDWRHVKHMSAQAVYTLVRLHPAAYCFMPEWLQQDTLILDYMLHQHGHMWPFLHRHVKPRPGVKIAAVQSCPWMLACDAMDFKYSPQIMEHAVLKKAVSAWQSLFEHVTPQPTTPMRVHPP